MTTFLLRLDAPGHGPTVAVKDLIDVAGTPTTCANRTLAERAEVAVEDAPCIDAIRRAGGRIVGKTNLHELAFGGTGINPYTGTPTNPIDPSRIPGGSSSGSAVAVATGEVDVAIGTDTAGSIRTPSACCGTVGLKTTYGRISTSGVHPLAPSLDTVGPMARDVAGVELGMRLLEPGFRRAAAPVAHVGRLRLADADPAIDAAVDAALRAAEVAMTAISLSGWAAATTAGSTIAFAEAYAVDRELYDRHRDDLTPEVRDRLRQGSEITGPALASARAVAPAWRTELLAALDRTPVIALVGIMAAPPPIDDPVLDTRLPNVAVNLAGVPSIVLPVPAPGRFPASIQLLASHGAEDLLVATAAIIEAAAR